MEQTKPKAGLILTGGGARAAYQVGVLKAIRDLLPNQTKNPFPILCGTSAGAINAAVLAINADHFRRGVGYLPFDETHCRALIDLGYRDTFAQRDAVLEFLGAGQ